MIRPTFVPPGIRLRNLGTAVVAALRRGTPVVIERWRRFTFWLGGLGRDVVAALRQSLPLVQERWHASATRLSGLGADAVQALRQSRPIAVERWRAYRRAISPWAHRHGWAVVAVAGLLGI